MTYAIQALAGIAIALGTFFGLYWRKIRKPVLRFFNLDETACKKEESDELVYFDPSVMKEERKIIIQKDLKAKDDVKAKGKIRTILEDMVPALFITLSGCFMVCIYVPLDLYFNNKTEFWFDLQILLSQQIPLFCAMSAGILVFYLICRLIGKQFYSAILFITLDIFICSYIQGNFRIENLPSMDGSPVDWSLYTGENLITLLIWIAVTVILIFIYRYVREKGFRGIAEAVSCLLSAVMVISLAASYLNSRNSVQSSYFEISKDHMFDVSDTENFYILILDAVDAYAYRTVSDGHPEYKEWFEDFTFFSNATSVYPFTSRSIPQILSGFAFKNEKDFTTFSTEALNNSPIMKTMEENGFRMGIYEPDLVYNGASLGRFDNIHTGKAQINPRYKGMFVKLQIKLVLFKYLPYCLKKHIPLNVTKFIQTKGKNPFTSNNRVFYDALVNDEVTHISEKNFRQYHIKGAHPSFVFDQNLNLIPETEGTYTQSVEASMKIAQTFINKLKDAGVYDQSSIIIMADHGYPWRSGSVFERFNPLLMVKGFNEKHPYTTSDAPISYYDLQEAYARLLEHLPAEECFDAEEGDRRIREVLYLMWKEEDLIIEYLQDGHASDYENLKPSGNEYRR